MLSHKSSNVALTEQRRIVDLNQRFRLHPSDSNRGISTFYECLDTPKSLACHMLFAYGEFEQLVNLDALPSDYADPLAFRADFAATSFLRKHPGLKTGIDLKAKALSTFEESESACKVSNERIMGYLDGHNTEPVNEWILSSAIRKIKVILDDFKIDNVIGMCGWGPGVTLSVRGSDTSGARKFDIDHDITADAYYLYGDVMKVAYPSWKSFDTPSFVMGNKIITVRKNAKTDRTIAVEPGLNSWIQKGIGRSIRSRILKAGFNLNSDLKNQRGAYTSSIDDSLATIDFKAASDTISTETVKLLLPLKWFMCLDAARSKLFTLNGVTRRSMKFSTMGNGFTFELESLIFLAIALATCEYLGVSDESVAIFGDDLVLPAECVPELTAMCTFLGFTINKDKSFSSGPFRESCGSYYFNGVDVKPIFLKSDVVYARDIFKLANSIRSLSHRHASLCGCDRRFRRVWSLFVHFLPSALRLIGAASSGDSCIHGSLHESKALAPRDGWCGFTHSGLPSVPISIESDSHGLLLSRLNIASVEMDLLNSIPLREKTRIVYKKRMFVSRWYDYGDWV